MSKKRTSKEASQTVDHNAVIADLVANDLLARSNFLTRSLANTNPQRDLDRECQYPATNGLTVDDHYVPMYERHPIARRVVDLYPQECWASVPRIYETEDNQEETEFEKAFLQLGSSLGGGSFYQTQKGHMLWEHLKRVDIQSGIGYFGILFLGLSDAQTSDDLRNEVQKGSNLELVYLRSFSQKNVQISTWETDPTSIRFGHPKLYKITFASPQGANQDDDQIEVTKDVHWSRIIHITDNSGDNQILGTPRMQPVYNNLLDLKKLYGGSAEGYWAGAFPGISFETAPGLGADVQIDQSALKDAVEKYLHRMQRYIALEGMNAKSLSVQVADPTKHIESQIDAICIQLGCPKRIFMGSERGNLASSQDAGSWNDRLIERQNSHINPRIIVPFVDRLIELGVLPAPKKEDGYQIEWPDLNALSDDEKATIALKQVDAMVKYINGDGEQLMSRVDFYVHILDMTPDEANELVKQADQNYEEDEDDLALEQQVPPTKEKEEDNDSEGK